MTTPAFDLNSEPWIRTRLRTGEISELSLTEIITRAHNCVSLAGELPTQDFAVLRLLLAIIRRSHPDAANAEAWSELWERGAFNPEPIALYLDQHHDRFDLLHPETPFYQVAGLSTAKGAMTDLARLVADVPAGHQFFTTRAGRALTSMDLAEAARWIVHCQAFDPSGIKSGALGDDRVKGGKGYPIGVAWCGWLGGIVVEGASLFHTLMLNLPLGSRLDSATPDLPVWERPPQIAAAEGRLAPSGPVDLLTWQSRRIRLGHDGQRATDVLIANGDPLHPRNMFHHEYMTGWRRSEAQEKAQGSSDPIFMPRQHQPGRALWRGLDALIAEAGNAHSPMTSKPGRWLEWLAELRQKHHLPRDLPVRIRAVGMHYGSQSAVTDDIADDALALSVAVLSSRGAKALALDAVRDADAAVRAVASLAGELAEAAGADPTAFRSRAFDQGYAALDYRYRRWVSTLSSETERDQVRAAWQNEVRQTLVRLGRDLVGNAGQAAWIGREVNRGNDHTLYLDAAMAENSFHHRLRQALPLAYPRPREGASA
ncbi:type I-E CRISPR-associated protein Cse1/CasA [Nocardioides immobilis]|uniref:Type I-E CRISPR-associated protein Cse1/CasA n=1 Tax=Nocardioides immobilis TaxID=2049295 RepID=A0A417XZN9_9ACTN|nr:type I-E CRISPR-associated protein Cse1/CasA [Nocardioides immobilis]RHW25833.1 type I-E CRISPR-associated protein Cse1/CasA [Nocardioides immobilis]